MKLAFCLFRFFPFGGLQRDFFRIVNECLRRGHYVDIYTMDWEGERPNRANVFIYKSVGLQNHTRIKNFISKLSNEFDKKNYDLIIGFNKMPGLDIYYAADTCLLTRLKEKLNFWFKLMPRYRLYSNYEKAVFSTTSKTKILLLAKKRQHEFIQIYNTEPQRFYVLPPGIEKNRIAPENSISLRQTIRNKLGIRSDENLLLMIGSGFKTKGLDRILRGLANLPLPLKIKTKLIIIGKDNPTLFKKLAQRLGIIKQIFFMGGRNDVPDFLFAADLLLHPAYHENTGTVLLEALAAGLPILTNDVCGYAEYVEKAKAGIVLSSPFKQDLFNERLQYMILSDKRLWRSQGIAFAKKNDLYSLPEKAVNFIESMGNVHA